MDRTNVNVLDCTIRDGGLMNNSQFDLETVRAVFKACAEANVDVCELGYRNSKTMFDPAEYGAWRFCEEEDMVAATEGIDPKGMKVSVMMDAHKSFADDLLPASESVIDMVRVATYVKDMHKAIPLVQAAQEKGYDTFVNIMAITHTHMPELEEALDRVENETEAMGCAIVDSFGNMYMDQLHFMVAKYQMHLKTKAVGVHFHNNQQLAFANTMEGIVNGATWADGTMYGLGRGAGNCPLELLIAFLKNPKLNNLPILECIGEHIMPLRKTIEWGYHIPYMITGTLNQHPQPAINWMEKTEEEGKFDYGKFFSEVDD